MRPSTTGLRSSCPCAILISAPARHQQALSELNRLRTLLCKATARSGPLLCMLSADLHLQQTIMQPTAACHCTWPMAPEAATQLSQLNARHQPPRKETHETSLLKTQRQWRTQGLQQRAQELGAPEAVFPVPRVPRHRGQRHKVPQRPLQLPVDARRQAVFFSFQLPPLAAACRRGRGSEEGLLAMQRVSANLNRLPIVAHHQGLPCFECCCGNPQVHSIAPHLRRSGPAHPARPEPVRRQGRPRWRRCWRWGTRRWVARAPAGRARRSPTAGSRRLANPRSCTCVECRDR